MNRLLQILLFVCLAPVALAQPVANFTATPRSGCAPMVVTFTSTSSGNPTSYSWNFGNGNTSTQANPVVPYTVPGTYTVTLTVTNASGSNTKTSTGYIVVNQIPTVSLSATPVIVCPGAPVSFSSSVTWNSSGSGTYAWDFGDGGGSTLASPQHVYTTGGTYTVKLTAINSVSCPNTDTEANLIFVYPKPTASFTASDTAVCDATSSTTFTAATGTGTGPFSYLWDFGDGGSPGSGNPVSHTYPTLQNYTVKLYLTDGNGCQDSMIRSNYIRRRNVSTGFTSTSSACVGANVLTSNTTGSTTGTMSYDFGDGSTPIVGTSASYNYTTAGTYTITQKVVDGGCVRTATRSVTISPQPNSNFTWSPVNPCPAPSQVQFTAAGPSSGTTYSWNFGDGLMGNGSAPAHWYSTNWMYQVTLGATSANGCSSSTKKWLTIYPIVNDLEATNRTGCAPLTVSFQFLIESRDTNNYPILPYPFPVTSVSWNFGDGSTGTGQTVNHTYTQLGQYVAVATLTTANGCTTVDSIRVYVGVRPTANFGASPRVVCMKSPVFFNDSSVGNTVPVNVWDWDFGDGIHSFSQNPVYYYQKPGTYTVQLAAGINGCYDTMIKVNYIVVNDPKASIRVRTDCSTPLQVSFADSSIGATSRIWDFGDGTTSTALHPVHTYASAGNYTVVFKVFNSVTGCTDSIHWPLNLNPLVLNLTASRTQMCKNDTVRIFGTNTGGGVPYSWAYWIGTGSTPSYSPALPFTSQVFSVRNSGFYHVAMEVYDQNGCPWHFQRNNYLLVGGPNVTFSAAPPVACLPYGNVTFSDNSTHPPTLSAASRTWDFGDGSNPATTTGKTIQHTYSTTGSYGIKLIVTDNIGCTDSGFALNYLKVSDPTAIWSTTSTRACENTPFYFFNSSTGSGLTYAWSFGDGTTSTAGNPVHVYNNTGTYNVRLIVTDAVGCKDTMLKTGSVTVNSKPKAAFTTSDTLKICPPMLINFTDQSTGAVRWNWNFGTGGTSVLQNPTHTFTVPNIYAVQLVATNQNNCSDTTKRIVRLLGYDGVMTYTPLTGCAPLTVTFRANNVDHVPGFIYNFGDGNSGATTGRNYTYTYKTAGKYVPSITLTDNLGCSATSKGLDTIKVDGILAGFTFSPFPACDHGTIRFIDTSKGALGPINAPTWRFHDGTSSSDPSPTKTYAGPGTYTVTMYNTTLTGCRDTMSGSVVFHRLPNINAGIDTMICRSDTVILKPRGGVSYVWSPSNTLTCSSCTNPGAFPTIQTRYTVVGTDTNGCKNSDTVLVRIRVKVEATALPDVEICSGTSTQLAVSGGGDYEWTPPNTLTNPNTATPIATPVSTVQYMVISRLSSCIPDTDYVKVTVHETPTVDAGRSRVIVAGDMTQLEGVGTGPIALWDWSPPEGLNCPECYNPEARPKKSTLYTVKVTSDFGCEATDTVRVTVLCDQSQIFIPNTFTPEGNGVNDVFYPRGRGIESIGRFRIYNRWGELVFERTNMAVDDKSQGWDGRKEGRLLSPDVYVYTVEATCDTGEPIKWQGDVMLLR